MFACCILGAKSPQTTPCKKALPPVGLLIPSCSCGNIYTHTKKTYGFHQMPRNAFGILWIHIITYLHSQLSNARLNVVQDLGQQFQTQLLVSHECIHSYLLANSKRQRHAMGICSIPLKRRTAQRSISTAGNGAHKHHAITQPQYYQNGA